MESREHRACARGSAEPREPDRREEVRSIHLRQLMKPDLRECAIELRRDRRRRSGNPSLRKNFLQRCVLCRQSNPAAAGKARRVALAAERMELAHPTTK